MKIFNLLQFFKTKNGIWTLRFLAITMISIALKTIYLPGKQRDSRGYSQLKADDNLHAAQVEESSSFLKIKRNNIKLNNSKSLESFLEKKIENIEAQEKDRNKINKKRKCYIDIYSKAVRLENSIGSKNNKHIGTEKQHIKENQNLDLFAPVGRLLKCELVNTIDSSNIETPIIGIITEDLYWNGHLIIPANTEVHGIAKTDRMRQRIVSGRKWKLIFPKGFSLLEGAVLELEGVALDREESADSIKTYGITDGSFGLKGYRIMNTEPEEIKMFVASFMQGLLSSLQSKVSYNFGANGFVPYNSLKNASLEGTANAISEYIKDLRFEIEEKGFYTRVPAGKQFYLYINERIEPYKDYCKKTDVFSL